MAFPLRINNPSGVVQCGEADLLWSGGKPPYSLSVLSAQSALDSRTLASVGSSFDPHLAFTPVPIPGDTLVKFRVIDSSSPPQVADTIPLAIGESKDDSCLPPDQRTNTSTSTTTTKAPSKTSGPQDPPTSQPALGSETTSPPTQPPAVSSGGPSKSNGDTSSGAGSLSGASGQGTSSSGGPASLGGLSPSSPPGSTPSGDPGSNSTGAHMHVSPAVVGAIAGGVIILILVIAAFYVWRKRVRRNQLLNDEDWFAVPGHTVEQQPPVMHEAYNRQPPQQEYDAATYAAQAQAFYPGDVKRPLHVMSADADSDTAAPSRAESSSAATEPVSIPTQLSADEMARLADLVARRMRTQPSDVEEPPPQYQ